MTKSVPLALPLILIALLGAAGWATDRPVAEPPALSQAGRFQMTLSPRPPSGGYSTVFLLDTATGECWYRSAAPEDKWASIGSPVKPPEAGRQQ